MAATQATIYSRTGRAAGEAPVAPAAPAPTRQWLPTMCYPKTTIALIVAAVIVSIWGLYIPARWSNPHPAAIGSWGRNHWFTLLILWGIGAALIWLNASERAAKTLQMVLAGTVAAVLIVFPLWGWTTSPSVAIAQKQVQSSEVGTLTMPANGESEPIRPTVGRAVAFTKSTGGYTAHYVYADGRVGTVGDPASPRENGHIVAVYVKDTSGAPNSVTYEFVRP